jgi:hypothetical protein
MKRKTFWMYTVLVALCGLSISAVVGWNRHQQPSREISSAAWKERYQTPDELVKGVDTIVLAEAVSAMPGRVAYSSNGEDALPFEVVEFRVNDGLKGAKTGQAVLVERAGGTDSEGRAVHVDMDGGAFEKGGTYLLFLKQQEEGPYYYQVNDQGRYLVSGGRLKAVSQDDPVTAVFQDRPVAEALELVKRNGNVDVKEP